MRDTLTTRAASANEIISSWSKSRSSMSYSRSQRASVL